MIETTPELFLRKTGRQFTLADLEPRLPDRVYTLAQLEAPFTRWLSELSRRSMSNPTTPHLYTLQVI